jgi:neutral amino acid transport system ATP-binding protein
VSEPATQAQAPEHPAANGQAIFQAEGVVKRFGGIRAVNGASMRVQQGSITALIGPNGAGKTTFFNLITGFYRADAGAVNFDGASIAGKQPYSIARLGMVRTFQITKALSAMPVIDNMTLAAPNQPGEKLRNLILRPATSTPRQWSCSTSST